MALPADLAEAAALALRAGVDIDMMSGAFRKWFGPGALARGLVSIEEIDAAVRRVLRLKRASWPFRRPLPSAVRRPRTAGVLAARRELAREAARRSIVVLTNERVLPLPPGLRRIARHRAARRGRRRHARTVGDGREPFDDPSPSVKASRRRCPMPKLSFARA